MIGTKTKCLCIGTRTCQKCGGTGKQGCTCFSGKVQVLKTEQITDWECNGTGKVSSQRPTTRTCDTCKGEGQLRSLFDYRFSTCPVCGGKKTVPGWMTIRVHHHRCGGRGYYEKSYYDYEDCPRCNGGRAKCDRCRGSGVCQDCSGRRDHLDWLGP